MEKIYQKWLEIGKQMFGKRPKERSRGRESFTFLQTLFGERIRTDLISYFLGGNESFRITKAGGYSKLRAKIIRRDEEAAIIAAAEAAMEL